MSRCIRFIARLSLCSTALLAMPDAKAAAQWVPIDVGTLGGWTFAEAVNDSGQVVGLTMTADGRRRAFSWTRTHGLVDLGTLGGSESVALDVNKKGQVVGWSQIAGDAETHAFLWSSHAGMLDLGTLGGGSSVAYALSDGGQVVGASGTATGQSHAFSWIEGAGMVDVHGSDNGRYSSAIAVNTLGQVAGFSYTVYPSSFDDRAFLWTQAAGITELTAEGTSSDAVALNDNGQVVGWMETLPAVGNNHAFSWTASSGIIDLGTLDRTSSVASAVNSNGQVAGYAHSSTGADRAFLWTQGLGIVDLGTLAGSAHALAINDDGQVVGDSATVGDYAQVHAFSWTHVQGITDLGTAGQSESGAWAVNAGGEIVGYSVLYHPLGTQYHGMMWEPFANLGCSATLAGCNLRGAALAGAYLAGADLSGANLKDANLRRANLSAANLSKSNLKDVDFSDATLVGAQLDGANLNALWSNTICPDGTNSDANGGTCSGHLVASTGASKQTKAHRRF